MKKRFKFIMCSILIGIFCFGINSVKASTVTDFSSVSFDITGISDSDHTTPAIKVNGVEFEESFEESDLGYWVLISHSSTEFENVYNTSKPFPSTGEVILKTVDGAYIIASSVTSEYFEEAGDIYVTIYEQSGSTYTKATNAIKVNRPPYLPISKRFNVFTYNDHTAIYLRDIGGLADNRTVNYKIGKIPSELIKTLKNNTGDGLSQLLTYAKDDTDFNKEGNIDLSSNSSEILSNSNLVEKDYYYIYLELDDGNGAYYPVEDVSIYQSIKDVNEDYIWLYDYTDEEFSWVVDESPVAEKTETTVKNPKTGIYYGYGVLALIIAMGSAIYFVTRKKSKFPQA